MKRRMSLMMLAAFLVCVTLVLGGQTAVGQQKTIDFLTTSGWSLDWMTGITERFAAQHPEVKFEVYAPGIDIDFNLAFITKIASNDPPDVIKHLTTAQIMWTGLDGELMDLSLIIKERGWNNILIPGWDYNTFGDAVYYVPINSIGVGFYFTNKDIFDELGLTAANTLEEFYHVAEVLNGAGYGALALGGRPAWPLGHLWALLAQRLVGPEKFKKAAISARPGQPTDVKFTDPDFVSVFALEREWGDKGRGVIMKGMSAMSREEARELFLQGMAGMYSGGTWAINTIIGAADFNSEMQEYPNMKAGIPKALMFEPAQNNISISSKSEHKEVLYDLIDFMLTKAEQAAQLDEYAVLPVIGLGAEDMVRMGKPVDAETAKLLNRIKINIDLQVGGAPPMSSLAYGDTTVIMRNAVSMLVLGTISPEDAAAMVQESIETQRDVLASELREKGVKF